ncbi:MAG: DUF6326 family protein [Flavobacteriaceae bacterium]
MLKDYQININIKLSILWAAVTFLYLYGDYFELYIPKKAEGLVNGRNLLDSPMKLFLASLLLSISALMVILSILPKPILSKWLNIIFGIFFTILMLWIVVTSITPWRSFYVFYAVLESIITTLIAWSAFNWPKQK